MNSKNLLLFASLISVALCGTANAARGIRLDNGNTYWYPPPGGFVAPVGLNPELPPGTSLFEYVFSYSSKIEDPNSGSYLMDTINNPTFIYTDDSTNINNLNNYDSGGNYVPPASPVPGSSWAQGGSSLPFANGFMYNWVDSGGTVVAQVMVYSTFDTGPNFSDSQTKSGGTDLTGSPGNVLCDDADAAAGGGPSCGYLTGWSNPDVRGDLVTEIQFNYATADGCSPGGSLTFGGVTYMNMNRGAGGCDNTFVFDNGELVGNTSTNPSGGVPDGWAVVPLPDTLALLGSGLTAGLLLLWALGRSVREPYVASLA